MEQSSGDTRPSWAHQSFVFGKVVLLWLLLAGSLAGEELLAAVVVGVLVIVLAGPHLRLFSGIRLQPSAPLYLIRYLRIFSVALVRANLDMARRVLSPRLPLNPAVVEVHTELRSALGRLILANSITLTPGTLTIDIQGQRLLVHWVDCTPGTDLEAATRAIVRTFEPVLLGFLK